MGIHREIGKEKHAIHEDPEKGASLSGTGSMEPPPWRLWFTISWEVVFVVCLFFFLLQHILSVTMCPCAIYCLVTQAPGSPR